jgi:hypothetical protein
VDLGGDQTRPKDGRLAQADLRLELTPPILARRGLHQIQQSLNILMEVTAFVLQHDQGIFAKARRLSSDHPREQAQGRGRFVLPLTLGPGIQQQVQRCAACRRPGQWRR